MKTYSASDLSNRPAKIFSEVDKNGEALINHDRYPDKVFILKGRERREPEKEVDDE
jgi:hypothetical protein